LEPLENQNSDLPLLKKLFKLQIISQFFEGNLINCTLKLHNLLKGLGDNWEIIHSKLNINCLLVCDPPIFLFREVWGMAGWNFEVVGDLNPICGRPSFLD